MVYELGRVYWRTILFWVSNYFWGRMLYFSFLHYLLWITCIGDYKIKSIPRSIIVCLNCFNNFFKSYTACKLLSSWKVSLPISFPYQKWRLLKNLLRFWLLLNSEHWGPYKETVHHLAILSCQNRCQFGYKILGLGFSFRIRKILSLIGCFVVVVVCWRVLMLLKLFFRSHPPTSQSRNL